MMSKEDFNQLVDHPLQSWEWGDFRKTKGVKIVRLIGQDYQKKETGYQISFHRLPFFNFTVGYLPKSSLPSKEIFEEIKRIGKEQKAFFIKLEPNIESSPTILRAIRSLGLIQGKSLFTEYTSIIDLTRTEEEIFSSFKPKTRYNIRLAEKHGVVVEENNSEKSFEKYLDLLFETTNRQGFYAHDKAFHRQQWKILSPAGISRLMTASYKGQILSAFIIFVFNQTEYYPYGASTREHRELMAPTLLMWEAIKLGKKLDCKKFDLWGDTQPDPPPNHPYFGFHRFKEGFSPDLVEFAGSWDMVINPRFYQIYNLADKTRWKILRLKSKL